MTDLDVVQVPGYPGMWARRVVVQCWQAAGSPRLNWAGRTYEQQKYMYNLWRQGRGNAADNPDANTRQPHVRGMALDLASWDADTVRRMEAGGFSRPIWRRNGFSQDEPWHFEPAEYVGTIRSIPKVTAAAAGSAVPFTRKNSKRKRKSMSVGVIYTQGGADKNRQGAVIDLEAGFVSRFAWFPASYANGVAQGFGLEKAAPLTAGHFDALIRDAGKKPGVVLSGEVTVINDEA